MRNLIIALAFLLASPSAIYAEIFVADLNGLQAIPPISSGVLSTCLISLSPQNETQISVNCSVNGATIGTTIHVHGPAPVGIEGPVIFSYSAFPIGTRAFSVNAEQVAALRSHLLYVDIHNPNFPELGVRGQIRRPQTMSDDDRDGRSDPRVYRRSTGQFWVLPSNGGLKVIDGVPDLGNAVFLTNTWGWSKWFVGPGSQNGILWYWIPDNSPFGGFGSTTMFDVSLLDTLVTGDWDGDGKQDRGVFRRSDGQWQFKSWFGTELPTLNWGSPGDEPCVGDYDGDGRSDVCVVRQENGSLVWYILESLTGRARGEVWGVAGVDRVFPSIPVYLDGDGKQELMVYREVGNQRVFMIRRSTDNAWIAIPWGLPTDTPLFGDYDGDGKTDFVARRDVNGTYVWYVLRSSDGQVQYFYWGKTGDE